MLIRKPKRVTSKMIKKAMSRLEDISKEANQRMATFSNNPLFEDLQTPAQTWAISKNEEFGLKFGNIDKIQEIAKGKNNLYLYQELQAEIERSEKFVGMQTSNLEGSQKWIERLYTKATGDENVENLYKKKKGKYKNAKYLDIYEVANKVQENLKANPEVRYMDYGSGEGSIMYAVREVIKNKRQWVNMKTETKVAKVLEYLKQNYGVM